MIESIVKLSWTQPDGKMGYCYHVYYYSGRHVCYPWYKTLPITVTNFLLTDDTVICSTSYPKYGGQTRKREVFVKEVVE